MKLFLQCCNYGLLSLNIKKNIKKMCTTSNKNHSSVTIFINYVYDARRT